MLYRNEKFISKRIFEIVGDDIETGVMIEFCGRFAKSMRENNAVEVSITPSLWNKDENIFRAEVHIYHPDEIRRIEFCLYELYKLKDLNADEVKLKVREIAGMLGLLNQHLEHISENKIDNFNGH